MKNRRRFFCDTSYTNGLVFIELVGRSQPYAWIGNTSGGCYGKLSLLNLEREIAAFRANNAAVKNERQRQRKVGA